MTARPAQHRAHSHVLQPPAEPRGLLQAHPLRGLGTVKPSQLALSIRPPRGTATCSGHLEQKDHPRMAVMQRKGRETEGRRAAVRVWQRFNPGNAFRAHPVGTEPQAERSPFPPATGMTRGHRASEPEISCGCWAASTTWSRTPSSARNQEEPDAGTHRSLPALTVTRGAGRGQKLTHSRHCSQHSPPRAGGDPHVSFRAALPAPVIGLRCSARRCPGPPEGRVNPSTARLGKAARSAPRTSVLAATDKQKQTNK